MPAEQDKGKTNPAGSTPAGASAARDAAIAAAQAAVDARERSRPSAATVERVMADRASKRGRWMVGLIAFIVLGGIAAATIFGFQLRQMMIDADLTKESIRLNKDALDLTRDTAQRQLRAYLTIQEFKCGPCGDNAGADEVSVRAGNDGQTPARNAYARIGWSAGDPGCGVAGSGFAYGYDQARYFRNLRTFSREARDFTNFDVNRDVIAKAKSANSKLCVYGTTNYATIYSELGERETHFCYWYNPRGERTQCEEQNDLN